MISVKRSKKMFPDWEKTPTGAKAREVCGDATRPWKGRSSTVAPASGTKLLPISLQTYASRTQRTIVKDQRMQ